jgi:transposase
LLDSPFCSKRFAYVIGEKCRTQTIQDVAREHMLDWHTVKELDKRYMEEQLKRAGEPEPRVIGIDEISIKKRHQYRIIVSDLERGRAIWIGGKDRSEESMDEFFAFLGEKRSKKIEMAIMDMWPAFRKSTTKNAPNAAILFDKFHIIRHLGEALDKVRKQEYARLTGNDRKFIKGQKFALLSHRENLRPEARKGLKTLLSANKRLNTAYLLKESFGQLWDYNREGWARRFFDNWRSQLRWQRLKPYEKFARMIDKHWDGIAAYCESDNKVALGFVEGLNNKVRVIQRRAYGLRDEEYLRLKVLTCMLEPLPKRNGSTHSKTR